MTSACSRLVGGWLAPAVRHRTLLRKRSGKGLSTFECFVKEKKWSKTALDQE